VHFAFTDEQLELRATLRRLLEATCGPDDVRAAFCDPSAGDERWRALAELGVVGLTAPEPAGGLGLGLCDLAPLLEEAARASLPEPLAEGAALVTPLLADVVAGTRGGSVRAVRSLSLVRAVATGAIRVAVAPLPAAGAPGGPATCDLVPHAAAVDLVVAAVPEPGGAGVEVHAVPARDHVEPVASLDPTRRLGRVTWEPADADVLLAGAAGRAAWDALVGRAAMATAAQLVGLADRLVGLGAAYALDRHQFGRPIGSFQAVKHLLADARVALEFARPTVYAAAWALDRSTSEAGIAASVAKSAAGEAAATAARAALQVHGAIGYTWECDLQLYLKRTWALVEAWGSPAHHRALLLSRLADQAGTAPAPAGAVP
jgi:alkylation response protein AidB-like acyl-CoA dehydrogenase